MKREVKSVSGRSSVRLSHGPFPGGSQVKARASKAMAWFRTARPRQCSECLSLQVSPPPLIHQEKQFLLSGNWAFHPPPHLPHAVLSSSIPVRKWPFPWWFQHHLCWPSPQGCSDNWCFQVLGNTVTPPKLMLTFWAPMLIFQHQPVSQGKDEKQNWASMPSQDAGCWAGLPRLG